MRLSYALRSVIGTRPEQQDSALCRNEKDFLFAVVCDGMGGLESGYEASSTAVQTLDGIIKCRDKSEPIPELFLRSIDILDEKVYALRKNGAHIGTTVVSVIAENGKLWWFSVGDSRLYILRRGDFVQATRDHNYEMMLNMAKDYVPTQEDLSKKHALVSFVGMGGIETMDISKRPVLLTHGDIILLTSDGLYNSLDDEDIREIILRNESLEQTADELIKYSEIKAPTVRDNTTFILIKAEKEENVI